MREFTNEEMQETAQEIFKELIHVYYQFHSKKNYTKFLRITVHDDLFFELDWKKLTKKSFIITTFKWNNYCPNEDDLYLLGQLEEFFSIKTIREVIEWYSSNIKKVV
jgi:hypothetical protein